MARRRRQSDSPDSFDPQPLISAFSRLPPRTQGIVLVLVLAATLIAAVVYFSTRRPLQPLPQAPGAPAASVDMVLGNPSSATADPANKDNYLMVKPYYSLAYNNSKGTANWVSWRVASSDLGNAPRKRIFDTDTTLPAGFGRITSQDYTGSGFDRGHLCPHSDRAATQEMSFATFVMTNIIPQAPNVNEKAWAQLEGYCRQLVRRQHQHLYITAGPAGRGGKGASGLKDTIASGKVAVPAECWKIIVSIPESGAPDDLLKINATTRVITVIMPNDNGVGYEWAKYRTTPAEVERRTGLHFFDHLSPTVADVLRQQRDDAAIAAPQPTREPD